MLRIIMAKHIKSSYCKELSELIEFNNLFIALFNCSLKPKFNFLTHYPSIMHEIGPLNQTNTLRYESKHRELKSIANNCSSRINITQLL